MKRERGKRARGGSGERARAHLCSSLQTGEYAAGVAAGAALPSRMGVPAAAASARTRASSAASSSHAVSLVSLWT